MKVVSAGRTETPARVWPLSTGVTRPCIVRWFGQRCCEFLTVNVSTRWSCSLWHTWSLQARCQQQICQHLSLNSPDLKHILFSLLIGYFCLQYKLIVLAQILKIKYFLHVFNCWSSVHVIQHNRQSYWRHVTDIKCLHGWDYGRSLIYGNPGVNPNLNLIRVYNLLTIKPQSETFSVYSRPDMLFTH